MKVSELGEFGLIDMLSRIANESGVGSQAKPEIIEGLGDDAAAWQGEDSIQLCTTDMLVQDVHFDLNTTPWHDLGWKALAVNISDLAAMGGSPSYTFISLGLPAHTEVEQVSKLYRGMAEIARRFEMVIVGGDTTEAPHLVISPTIIGKGNKDRMLTRSGATIGDQIAVTGCLGASAAGLRMLREKIELDPQATSALKEAHLRPWPKVAEGQILAEHGVKACIDISDGLMADLGHICEASKVEARVHLPDTPVHPVLRDAFGEEALKLAVGGGEDYELLFTASREVIREVRRLLSTPVTVIGEIVSGSPGEMVLLGENGEEVGWGSGGWEHFGSR